MRVVLALASLLVGAALAGCASTPAPSGSAQGVPLTTPSVTPPGAPPEGTPETAVYAFNQTFSATSQPYAKDFSVPKAGWLCIDASIVRGSGDAALTILDASGNPTTIVSTRDGTLHNETILANDAPSTWHVRVDFAGFTGSVALNVTQMG
jgi:curli biogenesis system outer membrane secretion channel CsgG